MESLTFDSMAKLYDETRNFNEKSLSSALGFLTERFPPYLFKNIFEPGIGTGRIAIQLAKRGYRITGVDISEKMLEALKTRVNKQSLGISFQMADATELPFNDATFDIGFVVHLFYFIRDWKKAVNEILRVVKRNCPIILMHTGTGSEIPSLNNRYKELCSEQNHDIESVGVKSTKEVTDYFQSLGCHVEWIKDRWKWVSRIKLSKAISYLDSRAYSFTAFTAQDIHSKSISLLKSEYMSKFGLDSEIEVPNQIYFVIVSRNPK